MRFPGLKVGQLLRGYRNTEPGDEDALIDLVCRLADSLADPDEAIDEVDLNPVIVRPRGKGAVVVDAAIAQCQSSS